MDNFHSDSAQQDSRVLHGLMTRLANRRPIFHSERDMQLALGWLMQEAWPVVKVRLEYRPTREREYIDIFRSTIDGRELFVELKYRTRALGATVGGEQFDLVDHSAHDHGCYDFLKDVERLERLVGHRPDASACCIILTNDWVYWTPSQRDTNDACFRLHEGREIVGDLAWKARASEGTTKGRDKVITLRGRYRATWTDYSTVGNSTFRYLLLAIDSAPR